VKKSKPASDGPEGNCRGITADKLPISPNLSGNAPTPRVKLTARDIREIVEEAVDRVLDKRPFIRLGPPSTLSK
jgi:hypothetical protein